MEKIIELQQVSKLYNDANRKIKALDDINLSIKEGQSTAIIGSSGSGKTTMLHILGGLIKPDQGKIRIDGKYLNQMKDNELSEFRSKTIGFVFQFFYLQEYLTTKENVELALQIGGLPNASVRATDLLKKVGLENRLNHYPNQISGGEMQRVAVARALANNPKIILADEPTGNLDKENASKILNLFDEIARSGVTVIIITHDEWIAKKFENIIRLDKGKLSNRN